MPINYAFHRGAWKLQHCNKIEGDINRALEHLETYKPLSARESETNRAQLRLMRDHLTAATIEINQLLAAF